MKPGEVVYTGISKKGKEIVVRFTNEEDVEQMCLYINTLSKEQTFISFQGNKISISSEKKYVRELIKKIKNNKAVQLLAFYKNTLIGISDVFMGEDKTSMVHIGIFGLTIAKDFRGEGIGKMLMEKVLEQSTKHLTQLRVIKLSLFNTNSIAKDLYKEFGFIEYGFLPSGLFRKGEYIDEAFMYKVIR